MNDIKPVVRAEWQRGTGNDYYCSNCKAILLTGNMKFCYNCGAEMRGNHNVDTCVSCGEIIPEGRQVCPKCEVNDA